MKAEFGDKLRRSQRSSRNAPDLDTEDLITPQDMVVTLSHTRLHEVAAARRNTARRSAAGAASRPRR